MQILKSTCQCKNNSESDLVIAIKEEPFERWGCLAIFFNLFMLLITGGIWGIILGVWVLNKYFLSPIYRCQFCSTPIEKTQFRNT